VIIGFGPSEYVIINPDATSGEFDFERRVTLLDKEGRQLNLRLNYM
jgi:hypothetical protein